jgi:hypothetical protein
MVRIRNLIAAERSREQRPGRGINDMGKQRPTISPRRGGAALVPIVTNVLIVEDAGRHFRQVPASSPFVFRPFLIFAPRAAAPLSPRAALAHRRTIL